MKQKCIKRCAIKLEKKVIFSNRRLQGEFKKVVVTTGTIYNECVGRPKHILTKYIYH